MTNFLIFLLNAITLFVHFTNNTSSTCPVVLIHGIRNGSSSMEFLSKRIQQKHPKIKIYNINHDVGVASLEPMWHQVEVIGQNIMNFSRKYRNGINLIGYSQGGLIARVILQRFPHHNVRNFISLSAPQAGQYGRTFQHLIFPHLVRSNAYELFYSVIGQYNSVGNYWNDPYHQDLYLEKNVFLPYVNNEKLSVNSTEYKNGITKLNRMILIGGPDDGAITPWQSSHFGYFGNDTVVEMRDRDIYKKDAIGLKTLDDADRLVIHSIPGVNHSMWVHNETVIDNYILPYLN